MLKNILITKRDSLLTQISSLQKSLKNFPADNLICVQNGKYSKWFKSNGNFPIYIPKKERDYAEKLAVKKYYSLQLKDFEEELDFIEKYLQYLETKSDSTSNLLQNFSYKELLQNYFNTSSKDIQLWLSSDYEQNSYHLENLIHETYSGQNVRSKSEVIIANTLSTNKIPFRYECALHLGDFTFFPDFTLLHPQTKKIYYWEHFGMMQDSSYRDNAYNKLKIYGNYNIIPSINLITTYETQTKPINSYKIEQLVQETFLI